MQPTMSNAAAAQATQAQLAQADAGQVAQPPTQPPQDPMMAFFATNGIDMNTKEAQAAFAEVKALDTPEKVAAKAKDLGLEQSWQDGQAKINSIQGAINQLSENDQKLKARGQALNAESERAMSKVKYAGVAGIVLGVGVAFAAMRNKDWGAVRKIMTGIAAGVGASVATSFAGAKMFTGGLREKDEAIAKDTQLHEMQKQELKGVLEQEQQTRGAFIVEMMNKLMERDKAQAVQPASQAQPAKEAAREADISRQLAALEGPHKGPVRRLDGREHLAKRRPRRQRAREESPSSPPPSPPRGM